jgi:hypothetical protein
VATLKPFFPPFSITFFSVGPIIADRPQAPAYGINYEPKTPSVRTESGAEPSETLIPGEYIILAQDNFNTHFRSNICQAADVHASDEHVAVDSPEIHPGLPPGDVLPNTRSLHTGEFLELSVIPLTWQFGFRKRLSLHCAQRQYAIRSESTCRLHRTTF